MKNDKDSIFEAYTQTLTEGWEAGTSKAPKGKSFDMSKGGAPSGVDAASDGSGGRYRKTRPPSAQSNKTHGEMEEDNLDNTPLEELSILSPEEYEMVQNFENFDADDWGYNKLQKFYFRKREGGEDEEKANKDYDGDGAVESSTAEYMGSRDKAIKKATDESEESALSPQEIARNMMIQRQNEMQNFYIQERLSRYGYSFKGFCSYYLCKLNLTYLAVYNVTDLVILRLKNLST